MTKILALFIALFSMAVTTAERLPNLRPLSSPTTIAETILDTKHRAPEGRFIKKETQKNAPSTATKQLKIKEKSIFSMAPSVETTPQKDIDTKHSLNKAVTKDVISETIITETSLPEPSVASPIKKLKQEPNDTAQPLWLSQTSDEMLTQMHFYASAKMNRAAYQMANTFLNTFIEHPQKDIALYYIALYAENSEQRGKALQQLKVQHESSPWTQEAAYKTIWNFAQTNSLNSIFKDKRAKKLQQRVNTLPTVENQLKTARIINVFPGAGHLINENILEGILYITLSLSLLWAAIYALTWGHIPYATTCALLIFCTSYVSYKNLTELVVTNTHAQRSSAFNSWTDLAPPTPSKINTLATK